MSELALNSGKTWSDEQRIKELRMFLEDISVEEIAKKFKRTKSAIEQDKSAFKAFLKGTLHKSYLDSNFFKHCRLLLLEILGLTI